MCRSIDTYLMLHALYGYCFLLICNIIKDKTKNLVVLGGVVVFFFFFFFFFFLSSFDYDLFAPLPPPPPPPPPLPHTHTSKSYYHQPLFSVHFDICSVVVPDWTCFVADWSQRQGRLIAINGGEGFIVL